ncbi:MAG: ribose-5-phosphate isomerase A, partial [Calditrichaeota bacterium]|nr:ribose-5-phosphate isomerase A [Calditrichota bacterium]
MTPQEKLKQQAAHAAVEWIENGMIVGLGTGSTVRFALEKIAEKIRTGELQHIAGIPSSEQTELRSRELGIPLTDFAAHTVIDVTIDGADEVD